MMEPKAKPAATVMLNGRAYVRHANVGAWWEMCPWAVGGTRVVASGDLRECLDAFADRDAEIARLNGIIDAERDMQAKLVAEGTRLSTDLAAARAALDKEQERALIEAAEEFDKEPQEMMSGKDIADYLRFRANPHNAAKAPGDG